MYIPKALFYGVSNATHVSMYDHAKCTVRQRVDTKNKSLQTTVQRLYTVTLVEMYVYVDYSNVP